MAVTPLPEYLQPHISAQAHVCQRAAWLCLRPCPVGWDRQTLHHVLLDLYAGDIEKTRKLVMATIVCTLKAYVFLKLCRSVSKVKGSQ